MTHIILLYIFAGISAGLISGMLGLGGGIIMVPILAEVFTIDKFPFDTVMHLSVATSLAIICVTSLVSVFKHHQHQNVNTRLLKIIAPAAACGAIVGGWLHPYFPADYLYILFAITLTYSALKQFFSTTRIQTIKFNHQKLALNKPLYSNKLQPLAISFTIGVFASTLGIGGGILLVPYLMYCNLVFKQAAGTASGCTLALAVTGTISIFISTIGQAKLVVPNLIGHIYLPAFVIIAFIACFTTPIGVKLARAMPELILKRTFGFIMLIFAVRMFIRIFY